MADETPDLSRSQSAADVERPVKKARTCLAKETWFDINPVSMARKVLSSGTVLYDDLKRLSTALPSFNSEAFVTGVEGLHGPSLSANFSGFPCCSRLIGGRCSRTPILTQWVSSKVARLLNEQLLAPLKKLKSASRLCYPMAKGKLLLHHPQHDEVLSLAEKPLIVDSTIPFELVHWNDDHDLLLMCFSSSYELEESKVNALREANFPVMPFSSSQGEQQQLRRDVSPLGSPQRDCGICVEIFAGCARLSMATQKLGFQALAYDHQCKSQFPAQMLDLTCADHATVLPRGLAPQHVARKSLPLREPVSRLRSPSDRNLIRWECQGFQAPI